MPVLHWLPQNALLAALPDDAKLRLSTQLERVQMPLGAVLCEPGLPLRDVYFPETSVVAISYAFADGSSAEVALIGSEGVVGVRLLMGAASLNVRASVQSAGSGFKLSAKCLSEQMQCSPALTRVILTYTASFIGQIVQTAAFNRHGSVEQHVCRWLLLSLDRMPGNELTMTHESIAEALGVKREGVTEAAGRLRAQGAISYRRGHITVLDRRILEVLAGECYTKNTGAPVQADRALAGGRE
ncbi:MAG: Crp/Fnr family transcriptional regulator [Burkholderiales bacterium]